MHGIEEQTTQTSNDDAFAAAFDLHAAEAAGTGSAVETTSTTDASAAQTQKPATADAGTDKPAEGTADSTTTAGADGASDGGQASGGASEQDASGAQSGAKDAAPGAGQTTEGQSAKEPAGPDADLLERFAKIVSETANKQPAPKAEPQQQETTQDEPVYSKDEQAVVEQYLTDYPDVAKGEALVRRAEYQQLVSHVFAQVAAVLRPMQEMLQGVAVTTHLKDLQAAVPDYDDVRDKVIDWVENQPKYLQDAYKRVINEGTQEEVVDLIERYRRETGVATTKTTQSAPAQKTTAALPEATKKAVEALAPVSTKRSPGSAVVGPDPNDFDGAFDMFASKAEG